jgi:hypothetical protein
MKIAATQDSGLQSRGYLHTPAMMSLGHLKQWYANYKAESHHINMDSDVINQVQSDVLQTDALRRGLDELSQKFFRRDQLCDICRCLFNDWPDISGPNAEDSPTVGWKHAGAAELRTLVIEAAARKGCQFCGLRMQIMQEAQMFETIRKVEARIAYLKAVDMASLSVCDWGTVERPNQIHWINLPGKINSHIYSGIALAQMLVSTALQSSGIIVPDNILLS